MTLSVGVAPGFVQVNGIIAEVADGFVSVSVGDASYARFDLVVADDTGVVSVVEGDPVANPVFPAVPSDSVALAAVFVPANVTAITVDNISDKRVLVTRRDYWELRELADAPSPVANTALVYAKDNGSGKTQVVIQFPTGSPIPVETEV